MSNSNQTNQDAVRAFWSATALDFNTTFNELVKAAELELPGKHLWAPEMLENIAQKWIGALPDNVRSIAQKNWDAGKTFIAEWSGAVDSILRHDADEKIPKKEIYDYLLRHMRGLVVQRGNNANVDCSNMNSYGLKDVLWKIAAKQSNLLN